MAEAAAIRVDVLGIPTVKALIRVAQLARELHNTMPRELRSYELGVALDEAERLASEAR